MSAPRPIASRREIRRAAQAILDGYTVDFEVGTPNVQTMAATVLDLLAKLEATEESLVLVNDYGVKAW